MDQPKIERLLRLMRLMSGSTYYSLQDLQFVSRGITSTSRLCSEWKLFKNLWMLSIRNSVGKMLWMLS